MRAPNGISDLLHSERGSFCALALIAGTVLAVVGRIDGTAWLEFTKWLSVTLVASKTVTTAVETYVTEKPQIPTAIVHSEQKEQP